jgi:hypothetical protein
MCPICTVAVGAGLGISRLLGIDDVITSIWIGGFILSASFWFINWLGKRKFMAKVKDKKTISAINILSVILMYVLVLVPLKLDNSIGILSNRLWGIDKIVLGIVIGSIVFLIGVWADKKVRKVRGKQFFQYQKVAFPVASLLITSLVFWILTV